MCSIDWMHDQWKRENPSFSLSSAETLCSLKLLIGTIVADKQTVPPKGFQKEQTIQCPVESSREGRDVYSGVTFALHLRPTPWSIHPYATWPRPSARRKETRKCWSNSCWQLLWDFSSRRCIHHLHSFTIHQCFFNLLPIYPCTFL